MHTEIQTRNNLKQQRVPLWKYTMTDQDTLLELYNRGISAHSLLRSYVADQHGDNPYIEFSRLQIEREERYLPEQYQPFPEDAEKELLELGLILDALKDAESKVMEALTSGQVLGLGFTNPHEKIPYCVSSHQWHFLTVDFDKGTAVSQELGYVGLQFLNQDQLSDADFEILNRTQLSPDDNTRPDTELAKSDTSDPLDVFRQMENLGWHEVSISLVAGDLAEISARGKVKRVSYAHMGLVDKRIDKGILNRQGTTFLGIAFQERSKDSQYKKHVSRLRGQLKSLFGINKNPFHPSSFPNLHFPIFELNDYRDKADQRAKKRASWRTVSYDDENIQHQMQGSLSGSLEGHQEEYPVDPDFDEGDEADEFLKNR